MPKYSEICRRDCPRLTRYKPLCGKAIFFSLFIEIETLCLFALDYAVYVRNITIYLTKFSIIIHFYCVYNEIRQKIGVTF